MFITKYMNKTIKCTELF